jgi:hypothetical protein
VTIGFSRHLRRHDAELTQVNPSFVFLCNALTVFIFGIIGVVMICWGLYALAWDAWKAKRATSRVTICIAGIVAIGIGYLFTTVGFA